MRPALRSKLSVEERTARHRLIARDSLALSTLLLIVLALIFITYALFHSFTAYRARLEGRWKGRGEAALANHQPIQAIENLRSALAYAPDDRTLQIELAAALADAGRTQQAQVYFNTLHESEPGNGMINLQLARLAASQDNVPLAITQYDAALNGTWNGDGFVRRRQVRLELARYLIAKQRFDEARNQLLIAAGNAADNHALQLTVGMLLEQADGQADAYNLYRKAMAFSDTRTAAMIGAGRTAAAQSRYLLARNLLQQAAMQADFDRLPEAERAEVRRQLAEAVAILDLFPAESLPPHVRAVRVAHAVQVVRAQISACGEAAAPDPASASPTRQAGASGANKKAPVAGQSAKNIALPKPAATLRSAISAVQRAGSTIAGASSGAQTTAPATISQGDALSARWQQLPPDKQLEQRMERDPVLLESTLQLVYEVERQQAQHADLIAQSGATLSGCVPPARDAALLLKIANAPDEIDRQ